ncbi:BirA family biotin operon repressor/biotin-[acetyl-CoA-carboxylase] ligase [Flavobacterium endophyticum]|uniref:BirA family biotin operon repressor/biotin-[acetyl-CoA-carboxylase] ligase n=1 Tax=Flavobacterium endophyticum TaxID=1540163 RepID=A0A495M4P1_9FLAO|nr:biotin--[acetyl-CoA-carboxylase] ligase [Flavobacterium endophyticum]RKS19239.1 BirA family biotin operon repressor/biotin-[acetyl-CoA-carboxylase] ligase [Flavobacterium endophyticum]
MNIIKLDAINSTNDYLKGLLQRQFVENFTIVTAENQTDGKGQMGSKWSVQAGKNLTFSVLVKDLLLEVNHIFHLNVAVAVSIIEALSFLEIKELAIKWPNDILAGGKKIGGILIENSLKSDGEIFSIIGIGINVNQQNFENLPKASSLSILLKREINKEAVLISIVECLTRNVSLILNKNTDSLWQKYHSCLYKKGIPMPFENLKGNKFMGIISGVDQSGKLQLVLEDDSVESYEIKEIKMLY